MPTISLGLLIDIFSVLGALFAFWKGDAAERATAMVVIVNVIIGEGGRWLAPGGDSFLRLVVDGLTALVLLGITVRYGALWMGAVMFFFAAQFSLHSYYLVAARNPNDRLHAIINNLDWNGVIWCLIIGTLVAWRARNRRIRAAQAAAA